MAQNLALSLGTFVVCVAAFEIGLRLCGYGRLEIYQPDARLYWKLKPNQECYTKIGHKPVHINSHGTRGPEFAAAKPPHTLRILSLGDSRTFGWGLAEEETYSGRLQQLLQAKIGRSDRVEVINAGVNAWSYPQMLVYFREVGLGYQPDVVLLAEANLWTQFSEHNSPEFVEQFQRRVRLKNFLRHVAIYHYVVEVKLRDFYERHRTRFIPVDPAQDPFFREQQQRDPAGVFRSAIEDLCRLAASNRVQTVLLYLPSLADLAPTNTPLVLSVKREASRQFGIPLVDATPAIAPLGKALYLEGDPVHLNPSGNAIVAGQLFETMSRLTTHE